MHKVPDYFIQDIQKHISNLELKFELSSKFNSNEPNYRQAIRQKISTDYSYCFNREQLAKLADLTKLPIASVGYFSISHNQNMGGFSYSNCKHGFDFEQVQRISINVIKRVCSEEEIQQAPRPEFLWVAKEAAVKALTENNRSEFLITDNICENWQSQNDNSVFSYRIRSQKTLDHGLNIGFVFSEKDILYSIYFK